MEISIEKLAEHGFRTDGVISAELVAGREDLRREAGDTCPVCGGDGGILTGLLYLRTERGTLGPGGHAGFLVRVHLACGDWDHPQVSGGEYQDDDGRGVCAECLHAAGQWHRPLREDCSECGAGAGRRCRAACRSHGRELRVHRGGEPCWSCWEGIEEAEQAEQRDAAYADAVHRHGSGIDELR